MNVQEFKQEVIKATSSRDHIEFCDRSEGLRAFWYKLNHLGGRNLDTIDPATVKNIDATVELEEGEVSGLREEFHRLLDASKKVSL